MPVAFETFQEMQAFLSFGPEDHQRLKALAPLFAREGSGITNAFYDSLGRFPTTARLIEGRVDALKTTHNLWMADLFVGDYGEAYFSRRLRIGAVHAKIGIEPRWVEGVMHVVRAQSLRIMRRELTDLDLLNQSYESLLKVLDLDLLIINLAYSEEMFDRLTSATGMRRPLLINLIRRAAKV